jgi:adenylosuccinate synthase
MLMDDLGRVWGLSTGRKRRCGWLDLVVVKYSNVRQPSIALAGPLERY